MRFHIVWLASVGIAANLAAFGPGDQPRVPQQDVLEAIRWGVEDRPHPYPLAYPDERVQRPLGYVYTPFVRIALAAHAAATAGRKLNLDEVPTHLLGG
ncbi:MAG: hypothetical protein AB1806_10390 [Acidobacteriota bacterium]